MISAYVGLPGSGKSYSLMEYVILPALREGRRVVTNVPVKLDVCEAIAAEAGKGGSLRLFDVKQLQAVRDREGKLVWPDASWLLEDAGAVVVVDECWRVWPLGLKPAEIPELHRSFFAEHRHRVSEGGRSTEIVLCTQDLAQCSPFVRQLVDTTYRTRSMSRFGLRRAYFVDVYSGPRVGSKLSKHGREREIPGRYRAEVFATYTSHTMSKAGVGDERPVDSRRNVFGGALLRYGLPLALVAAVAGAGKAWSVMHPARAQPAKAASEAKPSPPPQPAMPRPAAFAGSLFPSGVSAPRLAGIVRGEHGRGRAAIVAGGRTYYVDLGQCWQEYADDWRCTWRDQVVSQ